MTGTIITTMRRTIRMTRMLRMPMTKKKKTITIKKMMSMNYLSAPNMPRKTERRRAVSNW